jgi:RHS repeat-associated protein
LLIVAVALPYGAFGCRESVTSSGPRNIPDVAEQISALAASTSASAALFGKVVEPSTPNGLIAASTKGEMSVDSSGGASYRVPIWVPDGINGLRPSLALEYDSAGPIGTLGPKWRVTGSLSVIQRCPKRLAQDGTERPVNFNSDSFCLDGQRLYRQSGTPNRVGDFQTELNPFQKISATANDAHGITAFQVNQPDGAIYYYGRTTASRLVLNTNPTGARVLVSFAYYVDKIQDRFGNSILISYTNHATQFTPPLGATVVQELFPSAIDWGGTGDGGTGDIAAQRHVYFQYQPASGYNPYLHQRSVGGVTILAGEHLQSISVYGPDGLGNAPLLKKYAFGYTTPSITGEQLLTSIQECDGAQPAVCKRSTMMTWEPGSYGYTRTDLTTTQNITDIPMSNAPNVTSSGHTVSLANVYRRIIPVDLNHDGRDDLVYRVYTGTCTSWVARLASASGTFGAPIALPGATDADTGCPGGANAGTSFYFPYTGDIFFADLAQNGYPAVISPHGHNQQRKTGTTQNLPITPTMDHYYVYYNKTANPLTYNTTAVTPDVANVTATLNPSIAIGDINGDGYPDIVRPSKTVGDDGRLFWYSSKFPTVSQNVITSANNAPAVDFIAADADGDGIAEVIRLQTDGQTESVLSPTLAFSTVSGRIPIAAQPMFTRSATMPQQLSSGTWNLDLNGDGVGDFVMMSGTVVNENGITGAISASGSISGASPPTFPMTNVYSIQNDSLPTASELGLAWRDGMDDGVRVVDFNLDGRDDLVLMGNGANSAGAARSTVTVLLSDGAGGFATLPTSIPIGDPSDGGRAAYASSMPYQVPAEHGYRTSAALDLNGDGLPDFVQLESGHVISYVRQGKRPDVVNRIVEGTGHQFDVTYAPLSDTTMYTVDSSCGSSNPTHLACMVRGAWLTKSIKESALETANLSQSSTLTYAYTSGQVDRFGGRGFVGFSRRDVYGPGSQHTSTTFSPGFVNLGAGYIYSTAFLPSSIRTDVDTAQGPNPHHYSTRAITYGNTWLSGPNNSSLTVLPSVVTDKSFDCPSNGSGGCKGAARTLSWTVTNDTFDVFGNLTYRALTHYDANGAATDYQNDTINYNAADTTNWLVRSLNQKISTSSNYSETVTRTTNYVTSTTTQELISEEDEPTGDMTTHRKRVFSRDARGRIYLLTDSGGFQNTTTCTASCDNSCGGTCAISCAGSSDPACTGSCMNNCMPGCMATCIATPSQTRTTGYAYEDADGVYVTTTTDAVGNATREWRHPGYGLLVERDDPNHLAETWTYDTFGRMVGRAEMSGATSAVTYADSEDPTVVGGTDLAVTPDGMSTATRNIHLDSMGRTVTTTMPVDSARTVTVSNQYNNVGLLGARAFYAGTPTQNLGTQQNSVIYTYDDLKRPLSACHAAADGTTNHCKNASYDGLQTAVTDESGHSVVRTTDMQGRLVVQSAAGISDATFAYGPFGQLERESVGDGSGSTTIGYDVRGRTTSVATLYGGTRAKAYNAFGEVVGSYKRDSSGNPSDSLSYGRDAIGRLTSVQGIGVNRTFNWDHSAQGLYPDTNSLGKLVDAFDGQNQVHFEYDANGRLFYRKWSVSLFGSPVKNVGEEDRFYDQYGRLQQIYYPKNLPGDYTAFNLVYTYDPFVGDVASLAMNGVTLWQETARNVLGQITTEALHSWGGATMARTTNYYLPTGQMNTQTLSGVGGQQVQETYTYKPTGLPNSLGMTSLGGSWTASFDYDNLNRLATWAPNAGAPVVTYQYDGDGNLAQRTWSGETASYSMTTSQRTVTVQQNGATVETDTYQMDPWGRIWDTPAATLSYNANDEVIGATEKNGNQNDAFLRDGLGERVATAYGTDPSGSYLLTLADGKYELRYNGTAGTYEERCRFSANGKVVGDQVRTSSTTSAATTFYLTDKVGSVVAEASNTSVVSARARRDPYGNLLSNAATPYLGGDPAGTNPDGTSRYGFGDHDREANLGLVDMNARFYSPHLGAFISPDSMIGHPLDRRDHNPFAYVWDNPVSLDDPSGHGFPPPGSPVGGDPGGGIPPEFKSTSSQSSDASTGTAAENAAAPDDPTRFGVGDNLSSIGSSQLMSADPADEDTSESVDSTNAPQSAGRTGGNVRDEAGNVIGGYDADGNYYEIGPTDGSTVVVGQRTTPPPPDTWLDPNLSSSIYGPPISSNPPCGPLPPFHPIQLPSSKDVTSIVAGLISEYVGAAAGLEANIVMDRALNWAGFDAMWAPPATQSYFDYVEENGNYNSAEWGGLYCAPGTLGPP